MRFISGLSALALAGLVFGCADAAAGPRAAQTPLIGVGSFTRGNGPVGVQAWGVDHPRRQGPGLFNNYGGGYGGGVGGDGVVVHGAPNSNVNTNTIVNVNPYGGGFYGGNGVFYGDDGYSRVESADDAAFCPPRRGLRHVYTIPQYQRRAWRKRSRSARW